MKLLLSLFIIHLVIFILFTSCSEYSNSPVQSIEKSILCIAQPGYNPNVNLKCGVRFKSFNSGSDKEVYTGNGILSAGNRTELDFYNSLTCDSILVNGNWLDTNYVSFSYSPLNGKLLTQINSNYNFCSEYQTDNLGKLNYLQISVANRSAGTCVKFKNVKLLVDGINYNVGDFSSSNWNDWMVNNIDLTNGFTIQGKIILCGTQPDGELNKVQILVGDTTQNYSGFIVQQGWNCISIPRFAQWMYVDSLLPLRTSSAVYKFHPDFKYYSSVDQLENGLGYFVEFNAIDTIKIAGDLVTSPVQLKSGWNLIGIYEKDLLLSQVSTNPPNIISSAFIRFDATNKTYTVTDTLKPGNGYWIETLQDGEIFFNTTNKLNAKLEEYYPKKDWQTIEFMDSKGRKAYLYYANKIDSKKFPMPPLFPKIDFDIRFEGDYFASDLSDKKSISITSSNYPIYISIKGKPLNITIPNNGSNSIISNESPIVLNKNGINKIYLKDLDNQN